jgi:capsid portal protein
MGVFKIKNDKRNGKYIGFVKGEEVLIFTYGQKKILKITEVEPVEILS